MQRESNTESWQWSSSPRYWNGCVVIDVDVVQKALVKKMGSKTVVKVSLGMQKARLNDRRYIDH